jgi:hypothetical protein
MTNILLRLRRLRFPEGAEPFSRIAGGLFLLTANMKFVNTATMKKCTSAVRALLAFGVFNAVLNINPILHAAANTEGGGYEVIANAFGFGADIPGCADASKNIREISIDELNIDARETTTGLDVEYRTYGPGQAHWGSAKFTSACTLGGSKELQAWFQEAAKGKNIRKNITVTLFKSDKTPGRSYTLNDCFPTQWSSVDFDPAAGGPTETITVQIGSIQFATDRAVAPNSSVAPIGVITTAAEPVTSDGFAQVRGFKVEIDGAAGGKEVDTAWESVSGGEMIIELTETTIGSDKFQTTSPGHKSVGEITLRGAMTDGRKALCDWINETVEGKTWKRMLTITELLSVDGGVKDGKSYVTVWAYPIRVKFPHLSVDNVQGNVQEEVEFRVIRVEPDLSSSTGSIEIQEAPNASKGAIVIGIQDLNIDVARLEQADTASEQTATIVIHRGSGDEILAWINEVASGREVRKNITINLRKNGRPAGTINLLDCLPVNFDTSSTVQTESLTVKIGRIEFKT